MKETSAKYRKAKAEADRLAAEIARLEERLVGVDEQQEELRSMATKGAVALYMHDSAANWAEGIGDGGEQVLEAARRARLIGDINELATAVVRSLSDSTRSILEDRRRLREKRQQQEALLAQLDGERKEAIGRFSALVAQEREQARQRREAEKAQRRAEAAKRRAEAAARRAERASRSAAARLTDVSFPLGFICPLTGPFKWGDGWGSGRGHKGADMLARRGSEQVAVVSGTIETKFWGGGGLTLFLLGDDGHTYTYMHLLRVVGEQGRHVQQGEVIGLTGASGNASAYHLHFEFHPHGGGAVDPVPLLRKACPPMPRDH